MRLPTPILFIVLLPLPAIKFVQFFTCVAFPGNKCGAPIPTLCPKKISNQAKKPN